MENRAFLLQYYQMLKTFSNGNLTESDMKDYLDYSMHNSNIPINDTAQFLNWLKDWSNKFNRVYTAEIMTYLDKYKERNRDVNLNQKMYTMLELAKIFKLSKPAVNKWGFKNIISKGVKKFVLESEVEDYISGQSKYEKMWREYKIMPKKNG